MTRELEGKVAVVTGAASGIGLASTEAMLAGGSRVVMVDRDEAALKALCNKHGDAVIPLVIDLLDPKDCATLLPCPIGPLARLPTILILLAVPGFDQDSLSALFVGSPCCDHI